MRTTIDIADPVLADLKKLQKRENIPLGRLVSSLLARALKKHDGATRQEPESELEWISAPMGARVELSDKDAVNRILDAR